MVHSSEKRLLLQLRQIHLPWKPQQYLGHKMSQLHSLLLLLQNVFNEMHKHAHFCALNNIRIRTLICNICSNLLLCTPDPADQENYLSMLQELGFLFFFFLFTSQNVWLIIEQNSVHMTVVYYLIVRLRFAKPEPKVCPTSILCEPRSQLFGWNKTWVCVWVPLLRCQVTLGFVLT